MKHQSANQTLLLHVQVGLLGQEVALVVLELLLGVGQELPLLRLPHQLLVEGEGVADGGDVLEVDGVGDLEALHAVAVPPLLEVLLEGPPPPVAVVPADLALVLYPQPVQLVQPVGDRLAVPPQRQVLRVVDGRVGLLALRGLLLVLVHLLVAPRLLLPHQVHRVVDGGGQLLPQSANPELHEGQAAFALLRLLPEGLPCFFLLGWVVLHLLLRQFEMLLPHQVTHKCFVGDEEFPAVGAVLHLAVVDVLVVLVPPQQLPLRVLVLEGLVDAALEGCVVAEGPRPLDEVPEVVVEAGEVGGVLGLVLVLAVDGEVVELVHVLQEPQVVVQAGGLPALLHHLAQVQVLHVYRVHVHVLALALLQTEPRLGEGRLEHPLPVIPHRVAPLHLPTRLPALRLLPQLLGPLVKVRPNHLRRLLLLGRLETLVPLDHGRLLLPEPLLLPHEGSDGFSPPLQHGGEVEHAVLGNGLLLGVVLDGQHLAGDCVLEHLDRLEVAPYLLQPRPLHLLQLYL